MPEKFITKAPESVLVKKLALAVILLVILVMIGAIFLFPKHLDVKTSLLESSSRVIRVPIGGDNAQLFFALALVGYVLAFYIVYVFIDFSLEGKFQEVYKGVKMEKKISRMKGHCIVCGYGRVGRKVVKELEQAGKEVVIMDKNSGIVKSLKDAGYNAIEGTFEDEDFEKAGIKNAKSIVACCGDDGKNLLIVMTARELNSGAIVASRASHEGIIKKLKIAGANHVIMPESLGGKELAKVLV